jgi:hypothetical protein
MARAFTGDFSTGNLTQLDYVISSGPTGQSTKDYVASTATYPTGRGDHTVQMLREDPDCGYVCRFELRDGDSFAIGGDADGMAGSQKSEINRTTNQMKPGETWWKAWSIKFVKCDAWPADKTTSNYLIFDEWHSHNTQPLPQGGGTVLWGMPPWTGRIIDANKGPGTPPGFYSLFVDEYAQGGSDPADHLGRTILLNVPINLGQWIDIKMEVKWAPQGYVRCWINNQPQTLLTGGTTWSGKTTLGVTPTTTQEFYYPQIGIYRSGNGAAVQPWDDMIIHHANYRAASTESAL